jgi:hypothetical protein
MLRHTSELSTAPVSGAHRAGAIPETRRQSVSELIDPEFDGITAHGAESARCGEAEKFQQRRGVARSLRSLA